jgi:dTDP-glucose 4,6-dehydratase
MRKKLSKILVTGGAGFIGSAFARLILSRGCVQGRPSLIIIDKLTYAGDLARLKNAGKNYAFYKTDICNAKQLELIFAREKPEILVNFAAETHVDRSILDARAFLETNILGTRVLLDMSRKYGIKKFIQVSTDEVYGEIARGHFTEDSSLKPSSPYAASKAAADLLIKAYIRTYNFPAVIIRPCNNYGPWQYPEKLIPLAIVKILKGEKVPVYGKGKNVREWLYVEDCARGIFEILEKGKAGSIYNLGSSEEKQNLKVVRLLLRILDAPAQAIQFVKDRPGHDLRYKLDTKKTKEEIGWQPKVGLEDGLRLTVDWSLKNKRWLISKWSDVCKLYKRGDK